MSAVILIVEDEQHLAEGLRFNLIAEGYEVEVVSDGEAALERLLTRRDVYDAVVLDVMLPGVDGFEVARVLREAEQFVPVLMLTARGRPEDVLRGFESGADDYLPKPFELTILLARLSGLLRRRRWLREDAKTSAENGAAARPLENEVYAFDGRTIDFNALELRVGGRNFRLTLMEAELMRYLIRHEGRIVSRKQILENVWGLHEQTDTRAIDNFIVRLRRYIEDEPTRPRRLQTVRGVGYRFIAAPADEK
jgi:DNA-binding response OmpR family regulator